MFWFCWFNIWLIHHRGKNKPWTLNIHTFWSQKKNMRYFLKYLLFQRKFTYYIVTHCWWPLRLKSRKPVRLIQTSSLKNIKCWNGATIEHSHCWFLKVLQLNIIIYTSRWLALKFRVLLCFLHIGATPNLAYSFME